MLLKNAKGELTLIDQKVITTEVCQTNYISPVPTYGAPEEDCRPVSKHIPWNNLEHLDHIFHLETPFTR